MKPIVLASSQTVAQIIEKYPETIQVWIVLKTDCVGCQLMRFCSLEYVAESYNMELNVLLDEMERAIKRANPV
jgi:hypothetical protein